MAKEPVDRFATITGVALLLAALPTSSLAGNLSSMQGSSELPGVSSDFRIVQPLEAEPIDPLPSQGSGQFKVGDVDVRISGSVTVDIGVGSARPPRR